MKMNNFNILHGDSTRVEDVTKVLNGHKIDLVHCDPPYCLLTRRRKNGDKRDLHKRKKIDHESVRRFENIKEFRVFTRKWLDALWPHLNEKAHIIIWTNLLGIEPIKNELLKKEYYFHGEYEWARYSKEKSGKGEKWLRLYEVALIFGPGPFKSSESDETIYPRSFISGRYLSEDQKQEDGTDHPNHKPFEPLAPLIKFYSNKGDVVFDPFAGSGSLPSAALQLNREAYGIELREHWAKTAQGRLKKCKS